MPNVRFLKWLSPCPIFELQKVVAAGPDRHFFRNGLFGMILDQFPIILMLHRCISIAVVFFLAIHIFVYRKFIEIVNSNTTTHSGNTNLIN